MLRKILLLVAVGVVLVSTIVVTNTLKLKPSKYLAQAPLPHVIDADAVARHMSEAVTIKTASYGSGHETPRQPFDAFIDWLAKTYPQVHEKLTLEVFGQYSLLFRWQGSQATNKPVLLTAHYDVVPVAPSSRQQWQHDPFAGDIDNGWVWGRGTLDDKGAVVTLMEAITLLLKSGFEPQQDIYFAFGHDEEVAGHQGAGSIVAAMKQRNIQFDWSLDEASFVLDGMIPGLDRPLASINLAEKGFLTIKITATSKGGHSSIPPKDMAIYNLAEALNDLHSSPFEVHVDSAPSAGMYQEIARYLPFSKRMLFANPWLFRPLLKKALTASDVGAAMNQTTIAPTMLSAGIKANVLAPTAEATVNLRIHPQDDINDVIKRLKQIIERERIVVSVETAAPASAISSSDSAGYATLATVTRQVFGDVVVAAGLTVAGTDSKHYGKVSDNSYRFNPMQVNSADIAGIHGVNERVSFQNLIDSTAFYATLIEVSTTR